MRVKPSKNQVRVWKLKRWAYNWRRKACNDDDEMTASGRPFQTWAAATGKARLPTVDSLIGGATRQLVLTDRRARLPGRTATATTGPRYRGALLWSTLNVSTAILYCTRSGTRSQCSVAKRSTTTIARKKATIAMHCNSRPPDVAPRASRSSPIPSLKSVYLFLCDLQLFTTDTLRYAVMTIYHL